MLASFFAVDVCSLTKRESKLNRAEEGGRRGGRRACRRDRLHRVTRDSSAGAACAGPKAQRRSAGHTRETCARRQVKGKEARTTAVVAVKSGQRLLEGRQTLRTTVLAGARSI